MIPVIHGFLGNVQHNADSKTYEAELRGLGQRLAQKIGQQYTPKCRVDLFGPLCNVNNALPAEDFTQRTFVETVTSNREFTVPADATIPADPSQSSGAPDLSSGDHEGTVEEPDGTLRLREGPLELGTAGAPFLVNNSTDLDNIRTDPTAWYALTTDIDMSAFGFWTPIPLFRGGIDGRGHEIIGLDVDRPGNAQADGHAAFIDQLAQGAVIRRLGFRGGRFDSNDGSLFNSAPLVAREETGNASGLQGVIEDCWAVWCELNDQGCQSNPFEAGLVAQIEDFRVVRRCFASILFSHESDIDLGTNSGAIGGRTGVTGTAVGQSDNYLDQDRMVGIIAEESGGLGEVVVVPPATAGVAALTSAQADLRASFKNFAFSWWQVALTSISEPHREHASCRF